MSRSYWINWITSVWPQLVAGQHLEAPYYLPHPKDAGFALTTQAERVGQVRDWAMSFNDGSRAHIHEYRDGRYVVHRDAVDPGRGTLEALFHWVTESASGKLAAVVFLALVATGAITLGKK